MLLFHKHSIIRKYFRWIVIRALRVWNVKRPIFPLLARTCTHALQEFSSFCCHKCHTRICNVLWFRLLWCIFECVLTNKVFLARLTQKKVHRETSMWYLCFLRFCSSFSSRCFCGVTLVTAKKQHCCWKARAYRRVHVRVRMRTGTCLHDVKGGGASIVRRGWDNITQNSIIPR